MNSKNPDMPESLTKRLNDGFIQMINVSKQQMTQAEQELVVQFEKLKQSLPGNKAIAKMRESAFASFERRGLPSRKMESWHYTDLRTKMKSVFPIASGTQKRNSFIKISSGIDSTKVPANLCVENFSTSEGKTLENGVSIVPLAKIMQEDNATTNLERFNGNMPDDALIDLNTAFAADGLVIKFEEGTVLQKPLELVHSYENNLSSNFSRHLVELGSNVSATIVEFHASTGQEPNQSNCLVDVKVGENSQLNWIKIQSENSFATHLGTLSVELAAGSSFNHFLFNGGSSLARTQLFVKFAGQGATANLRGVSLVKDEDHSDITLQVDHAVPNCDSSEYYKLVVDGQGHGVYQGKVIVRPDAQKTNGTMMVQSLLLSDDAAMSSKPELEIFADDVQCGHGSTTGQIDEELLFYLRSRGIPESEARSMLILAFLSEVIEQIENEEIVEILEQHTRKWFSA